MKKPPQHLTRHMYQLPPGLLDPDMLAECYAVLISVKLKYYNQFGTQFLRDFKKDVAAMLINHGKARLVAEFLRHQHLEIDDLQLSNEQKVKLVVELI